MAFSKSTLLRKDYIILLYLQCSLLVWYAFKSVSNNLFQMSLIWSLLYWKLFSLFDIEYSFSLCETRCLFRTHIVDYGCALHNMSTLRNMDKYAMYAKHNLVSFCPRPINAKHHIEAWLRNICRFELKWVVVQAIAIKRL